jgi:hypothetical protein
VTPTSAAKFGFFVDALAYGTPPHGGIALGLDRLLMLLTGVRQPARRDCLSQDGAGHLPVDRVAQLAWTTSSGRSCTSRRESSLARAVKLRKWAC